MTKDAIHHQKTTLPSGLTIATEHIDGVKSVTAGIWVKTGSRHENENLAGVTHYLEHMLFKGTHKRTAFEIAQSMESVGGYLNAFTSTEYTCYYSRCLDTQLERALDVLTDMVNHSVFEEDAMEKEKKVVLEEMKMYKDSPDDYIFEIFGSSLFQNHPIGRPIIGFQETVSAFQREDLFDYMEQRYRRDNLLVAVAGNVDHEQVVDLVSELLDRNGQLETITEEQPLSDEVHFELEESRQIEQTHMILGRRSLHYDHADKYALLLANTLLGGGMSSRLHQNIREKYGYCYSIGTFNQSFTDSGMFGVYIGTDKEYVDHVRTLIFDEFETIRTNLVDEKELSEAKQQLKGKLLLAQESTSNRMTRLAKSELYFGRFVTLDELVEQIDTVTAAELLEFSGNFFDPAAYSEARLLPSA
ncbi:MAG: insulinase family protein [Bacteroidetes bacterium]|jgi:predicted Zn-dependent peptidase|nr:insulinase family protein [Bacteroidota bacterium]PTM15819.1 MAG: insulinase family protein [Bacteroidota bacterium]PTM20829.1 MAG: insulinase family protein [Bacteroidota bacterium]